MFVTCFTTLLWKQQFSPAFVSTERIIQRHDCVDYHIVTQKVFTKATRYHLTFYTRWFELDASSGSCRGKKCYFFNGNKWQDWFIGEVKFRSNLVVLNSFFSDQEGWLFFLFEREVINSAKSHNSTLNPTPVFVLAPMNAVTHKGCLIIPTLPEESDFNLF